MTTTTATCTQPAVVTPSEHQPDRAVLDTTRLAGTRPLPASGSAAHTGTRHPVAVARLKA
jgi:hypothetical protein